MTQENAYIALIRLGHEQPDRKGKDFCVTCCWYNENNKMHKCLCRGFLNALRKSSGFSSYSIW